MCLDELVNQLLLSHYLTEYDSFVLICQVVRMV